MRRVAGIHSSPHWHGASININEISDGVTLQFKKSRSSREAYLVQTVGSILPSVYSKMLRLCCDLKSKKTGKLIHSRIITGGFLRNICLSTGLIIFYSKLAGMENAQKVFNRMPERNVVTWTALISGYSRTGDCEKALKFFSAMQCEGVRANQFTYGSALSACTQLSCINWGRQIHGRVQKSRSVNNVFVQSGLVDLYSKCGKMADSCYVFESMEKRDLVSWNAMIGGFAAHGLSNDATLVFRQMLREGMLPDSFSFGSILRSALGKDGLAKVRSVHGCLFQFGFRSNNFLSGSLVDAYVKCGSTPCANQVYSYMQEKDVVSCTALIKGYACEGTENCTAALGLFKEAHRHMPIDGILLCSMLNICAKTSSLCLGTLLHAHALKCQNKHDVAIWNSLIDMYSKSGVIEDAKRVFDEIDEKNVISWTSLIDTYGKHGRGREAVTLYTKMEDEGLKPNDVTFLSLLFACSHNGLAMQGWECFHNMINKYKISPRAEHYSCLVDLVAREGRLEEAYDLMYRVPGDINTAVLGAILGACRIHGDTSIGQVAEKALVELLPDNPANYIAVSSIYAAVGSWKSARKTMTMMRKKHSLKVPGYSSCLPTSKKDFQEAL